MDDESDPTFNNSRAPKLFYSHAQFADYWTALVSRIRSTDSCDKIYMGRFPHPLIKLQEQNLNTIQAFNVALIPPARLEFDPIEPTEIFVLQLTKAASETDPPTDPPLAVGWTTFLEN